MKGDYNEAVPTSPRTVKSQWKKLGQHYTFNISIYLIRKRKA